VRGSEWEVRQAANFIRLSLPQQVPAVCLTAHMRPNGAGYCIRLLKPESTPRLSFSVQIAGSSNATMADADTCRKPIDTRCRAHR